jgi:D-alanine-D-alanine ligase
MDMKVKTVGVLMGGLSGERPVSLRSGENCLRALQSRGYRAVAIDALRDVAARIAAEQIDVAFLALHGRFGEDGTIQGLLEIMGIPYTGSGVLASALCMNKLAAKKVVAASAVPTPPYYAVALDEREEDATKAIESQLGSLVMVKPVEEGSSLGVRKCRTAEEVAVAVRELRPEFGAIFAEKFVAGTEITVGVLQRDQGIEALPILELVPKHEFYDYEAKYTKGLTDFVIPARLEPGVYETAQRQATAAFTALGCRGYARIDMLVDGTGTPWFIEANTLPGMTELSDLPAQAAAAGISYEDLVETILKTAVG